MVGRDQQCRRQVIEIAPDAGSSFGECNLDVQADTFDLQSRNLGHAALAVEGTSHTDIIIRKSDLTVGSFLYSISGLGYLAILLIAGRNFMPPCNPVYHIVPRIV